MNDDIKKAYRNEDFINSPDARTIRMLCEYYEPRRRFYDEKIFNTAVFFGSARILPPEVAAQQLEQRRTELAENPADDGLNKALVDAEKKVEMARYYGDAREFAKRMTEWSMTRPKGKRRIIVCTGGGPGIMQAANRGAADVEGGKSVGLGISLPHEEKLNPYVSPELGFEFHYFFMRKYWFSYLAKALVVFPGGFGTLDEMAEINTLRQTKKITKVLPTVLYGTDYWNKVLDVQAMADAGTISPKDTELMYRCNSVDAAFDYLTTELERLEEE